MLNCNLIVAGRLRGCEKIVKGILSMYYVGLCICDPMWFKKSGKALVFSPVKCETDRSADIFCTAHVNSLPMRFDDMFANSQP